MPDVFGTEGAGADPAGKKKKKKKVPPIGGKAETRGDPDILYGSMDPRAGETKPGRYVQYDNETGSIMLNLPPRFSKLKNELEEELMEEFYGEPSGAAEGTTSLEAWVKAWIEKKEKEDPDLAVPDDQDA